MAPALYLFDADGTLCDRDTGELLPHVASWFDGWFRPYSSARAAIITNQGGVGLRYSMERDGWGNPAGMPTASSASRRYHNLAARLGIGRVYIAYAYRFRDGRWTPTPPGTRYPERWSPAWRKPSGGMVLQAMSDFRMRDRSRVLLIGDRPEDEQCALGAGVPFVSADHFFDRRNYE